MDLTMVWARTATEILLAQAASESGLGGSISAMLPLLLMFGVIYLLIIRPSSKQRREHQKVLDNLQKDQDVVTSGGIYGKVVEVEEKVITLEIAPKVRVRVQRERIAGLWNVAETTPRK